MPPLAAPTQDLEILADAFGLDPTDLPDYRPSAPAPQRRALPTVMAALIAIAALVAPRPTVSPTMPHPRQPPPRAHLQPRLAPPAARSAVAAIVAPSPLTSTRGLLLIAQPGDTLASLFRKVYLGMRPPPYATVAALNPAKPREGAMLVFPAPPNGWALK